MPNKGWDLQCVILDTPNTRILYQQQFHLDRPHLSISTIFLSPNVDLFIYKYYCNFWCMNEMNIMCVVRKYIISYCTFRFLLQPKMNWLSPEIRAKKDWKFLSANSLHKSSTNLLHYKIKTYHVSSSLAFINCLFSMKYRLNTKDVSTIKHIVNALKHQLS